MFLFKRGVATKYFIVNIFKSWLQCIPWHIGPEFCSWQVISINIFKLYTYQLGKLNFQNHDGNTPEYLHRVFFFFCLNCWKMFLICQINLVRIWISIRFCNMLSPKRYKLAPLGRAYQVGSESQKQLDTNSSYPRVTAIRHVSPYHKT